MRLLSAPFHILYFMACWCGDYIQDRNRNFYHVFDMELQTGIFYGI